MIRHAPCRLGTGLLVLMGLCGPLPGCGILRTGPTQPRYGALAPARPGPMTSPSSGTDTSSLSAVRDFLARTQEYSLPPGAGTANADLPPAYAATPRLDRTSPQPAGRRTHPNAAQTVRVDAAYANTRVLLDDTAREIAGPALPVIQSVSIQTLPIEIPQQEPVRTNAVNEALEAQPADGFISPDRWLDWLTKQTSETRDFESEWMLRMAQLAMNRDTEAIQVSEALPTGARELLTALLQAAISVRGAVRDPFTHGAEALGHVEDLRRAVADRVDPLVSTVALCRNVGTFGVYEEMADNEFVAGRAAQTIVYFEIRNLLSERTEENQYRTRLATRLEVLTAGGDSVWEQEEPEITDVCRRRRNDFFVAQRITLPATLPAGPYVLKVLVEDKISGRVNEATLPFNIHAAMSVSRTP